jgi:hypothetical protein
VANRIGIGVAGEPYRRLDRDASEYEGTPRSEPVRIVAYSNAIVSD